MTPNILLNNSLFFFINKIKNVPGRWGCWGVTGVGKGLRLTGRGPLGCIEWEEEEVEAEADEERRGSKAAAYWKKILELEQVFLL